MRLFNADALIHAIRHRAADIIFRGSELMLTGKDSCNPAEWTRGYEQGVTDTTRLIESQNIVEAEPVKHGRWEFVEQRFYHGGFVNLFRCSECSVATDREHKYCPNCGAKMDLEG